MTKKKHTLSGEYKGKNILITYAENGQRGRRLCCYVWKGNLLVHLGYGEAKELRSTAEKFIDNLIK